MKTIKILLLFLLEKKEVFELILKVLLNKRFPKLHIDVDYNSQELFNNLNCQHYSYIFLCCDDTTMVEDAFNVQKSIHNSHWILVTEKRSVLNIRKWLESMPLLSVIYFPDLIKYDLPDQLGRHFKVISHSPTVNELLSYPIVTLDSRKIKLLEHLQSGFSPTTIQHNLGFSKSNYYHNLKQIKLKFGLSEIVSNVMLIKVAERYGILDFFPDY